MIETAEITGIVLAGGLARRMNHVDKGLIEIAGSPMISYVLEAMRPQVDNLMISANRNLDRYRAFGCPVVTDGSNDHHGPLAGIVSAMKVLSTTYLAVAPCDSPFLPADIVTRLSAGLVQANAEISVVTTGERLQPVFALMSRNLCNDLDEFLRDGGRKLADWYARRTITTVDFSDQVTAFNNINTPTECRAAARQIASTPSHEY